MDFKIDMIDSLHDPGVIINMDHILNEIEKALDVGLYIVALQSTLTLPGICAALESKKGNTDGKDKKLYENWYMRNVKPYVSWLFTAEDCYRYRCSLVHQASAHLRGGKPRKEYARFMSVYPCSGIKIDNCSFKCIGQEKSDGFVVDIPTFCMTIIKCVRLWENKVKDTPNFKRNYKALLNIHPDGIPPFITGVKVIG